MYKPVQALEVNLSQHVMSISVENINLFSFS